MDKLNLICLWIGRIVFVIGGIAGFIALASAALDFIIYRRLVALPGGFKIFNEVIREMRKRKNNG